MIFVPAVYKRPIQATETSYVVKNTWLLWKNSEFMQKIKKITFFFNFWRFWGENNAKNACDLGRPSSSYSRDRVSQDLGVIPQFIHATP